MSAKIISHPNNKNYSDNYDRIFKPEVKTQVNSDRLILDKSILRRATEALEKISQNPELSKNPVIMLAIDHIHEELELIDKDIKQIQEIEVDKPDIRREYKTPNKLEKKY